MKKKLKFNSKVIHGGQSLEKGYGAVMPPIYQTSTYAQTSPGKHLGYEYSRTHNPTRTALEKSLASIENGNHGFAFASGLAAMDAIIKLLKPGDEVIMPSITIISCALAILEAGAKPNHLYFYNKPCVIKSKKFKKTSGEKWHQV